MKRLFFVLVAAILLTSAGRMAEVAQLSDHGFSVKLTVPPGTNFGRFAAGSWYARTQIPADKSWWGAFAELSDRNWALLHEILEQTVAGRSVNGSTEQKVGDFFASATDVATIERLGLDPLKFELDAIQAAKDQTELIKVAARMHLHVGSPFFDVIVEPDDTQADVYGFFLTQGGMRLPSKEYYYSGKFARERWEFVGHVAKMLELAGEAKGVAFKNAETVLAIEKALAEKAQLPVDLRDPLTNYNKNVAGRRDQSLPGNFTEGVLRRNWPASERGQCNRAPAVILRGCFEIDAGAFARRTKGLPSLVTATSGGTVSSDTVRSGKFPLLQHRAQRNSATGTTLAARRESRG